MKANVNFLRVVFARVFVQAPKDNGFIRKEKAALDFQNSGEGIRNCAKVDFHVFRWKQLNPTAVTSKCVLN